jgi:hypothetical protein
MNTIEGTAIVIALFVLRLGFPLALTLVFGLLMNKLMNRVYLE